MKFTVRKLLPLVTFEIFRIIVGAGTLCWLSYRYFAMNSLLRPFSLADLVPSFLAGIVLLLASSSTSLLLLKLLPLDSDRHPATISSMKQTNTPLIVSIVFELVLAVATLFLLVGVFDVEQWLRDSLLQEVEQRDSSALLKFGFVQFSCCGVDFESRCSRDYPPFASAPADTGGEVSLCKQNSFYCQNNCLKAFRTHFLEPMRWERNVLGYSLLPLVVLNAVLLGFILYTWSKKRQMPRGINKIDAFEGEETPLSQTPRTLLSVSTISDEVALTPAIQIEREKEEKERAKANLIRARMSVEEAREQSLRHIVYMLLEKLQRRNDPSDAIVITVRSRSRILQQSMEQLANIEASQLLTRGIRVDFELESGVDNGGLTREWFVLITRQLFSRRAGLFVQLDSHGYVNAINPAARGASDLELFRFFGLVMALAIAEQNVIGKIVVPSVFKHLLGQPIGSIEDLRLDDPEYARNLDQLADLSEDELAALELKFEYEPSPGCRFPLLTTDGENVLVNAQNLPEYVSAMAAMRLSGAVKNQLAAISEGFHSLIDRQTLIDCGFDSPTDLAALICGEAHISVTALRRHAQYLAPHNAQSPVVATLWSVVSQFNHRERRRFLQFVSGLTAVPSTATPRLVVYVNPNLPLNYLPSARVCFNRLELPAYPDANTLRAKLTLAMNEGCEGFALS